ncbi:MAG: hypothetical protein KDH09_07410 [Chrysiogenetes bacterium]|nr:hypothetical protein [Chrysiogenetes bacterium]
MAPLVLLVILGLFAMPNYYEYRPQVELQETAHALEKLVLSARHASVESGNAYLAFDPAGRSVAFFEGEPGGAAAPRSQLSLPGSLTFGYDEKVQPFPSLLLEDGTNLAVADDGVTFENNTLLFGGGLLEGFPGLIYLRSNQGENLALYVRISGDVQLHEWDGQRWNRRTELAARYPQ